MSYREKEQKRRILFGQDNNALVNLIIILLVVFIGFAMVETFFTFTYPPETASKHFYDSIFTYIALPSKFSVFITRPWTLITNMFYHFSVWHIISSALWLWAFGFILQDLTGNRKIIPLFLYGSLAGSVVYLLAYNLVPAFRPALDGETIPYLLGANAGILAIAIATTIISPGYRIFPMLGGGIPLWILTVIYVLIDLGRLGKFSPEHLAHMAGAFMGFIFMSLMQRGYDLSDWMNNFYDWFSNLFNPNKPKKKKSIKEQMFYKSNTTPFTKTPNVTQQRIDAILDKINQKGYDALSQEEKDLLKRAGEEEL